MVRWLCVGSCRLLVEDVRFVFCVRRLLAVKVCVLLCWCWLLVVDCCLSLVVVGCSLLVVRFCAVIVDCGFWCVVVCGSIVVVCCVLFIVCCLSCVSADC